MNVICAFSSDRRELYKADIYRVLALPNDHIVHFRYKTKYVDDNLLQQDAVLKGEKVAIFLTHGNKIESANNQFRHISVRWAVITHTELSKETNVFHIYMKLADFCNVTIDSQNASEKMPASKFLSKLHCTSKGHENSWNERVLAIKDYFPKMIFFHLKGITKNGNPLSLTCQSDQKSCLYELTHGARYILRVAVANPDGAESRIEISDSNKEIIINCINPLESSIQFDDHDIPMSVKSLEVSKQASLLQFKPINNSSEDTKYEGLGEYATNIELDLLLGKTKPIVFGMLSAALFGSLTMETPLSDTVLLSYPWLVFLPPVVFGVASGILFSVFNRK